MDKTIVEILDFPDGKFGLCISGADEATYALFDERELQGGGYTWESIAQALVETNQPGLMPYLIFDAEADTAVVYSVDRAALEAVSKLVEAVVADRAKLLAVIEHAGDELE